MRSEACAALVRVERLPTPRRAAMVGEACRDTVEAPAASGLEAALTEDGPGGGQCRRCTNRPDARCGLAGRAEAPARPATAHA
jgi:hypothetical protein